MLAESTLMALVEETEDKMEAGTHKDPKEVTRHQQAAKALTLVLSVSIIRHMTSSTVSKNRGTPCWIPESGGLLCGGTQGSSDFSLMFWTAGIWFCLLLSTFWVFLSALPPPPPGTPSAVFLRVLATKCPLSPLVLYIFSLMDTDQI